MSTATPREVADAFVEKISDLDPIVATGRSSALAAIVPPASAAM